MFTNTQKQKDIIFRRRTPWWVPLLVVLVLFSGFLGWQLVELKSGYETLLTDTQADSLEIRRLSQSVVDLQKQITTANEDLKEVASYVTEVSTNLPQNLREEFKELFLVNPNVVSYTPRFRQVKVADNHYKVIGYKNQLQRWMKKNEFFLDQLVKKNLVLEWNRSEGKVKVVELRQDSLFDRLGLKEGDYFVHINGKYLTRGDQIRSRLLDLESKEVVLMRNDTKMTLSVDFEDQKLVELQDNPESFTSQLSQTLTDVSLEWQDAEPTGLKISNLPEGHALSKLELKDQDVLSRVNGKMVTSKEKLLRVLRSAGAEVFDLEFYRDNSRNDVAVQFSDAN